MNRDNNPISDAEILLDVIRALKLTRNGFATKCKFKSSMSVYNVLEGRNGFSADTISRIEKNFPEVNPTYLKKGKGAILHEIKEANLFSHSPINIPKKTESLEIADDFNSIPETLLRIEMLLQKILEK